MGPVTFSGCGTSDLGSSQESIRFLRPSKVGQEYVALALCPRLSDPTILLMGRHELATTFGIDEAEMRHRLAYYRIDDSDRQALRLAGRILEKHLPHVIDEFYTHLSRFPEAARIIQDAGSSIESLKKTNPRYFAELFRAEFDTQYYESRLVIGKVHAAIGLTPPWFFGAMNTYLDEVYPIFIKKLWGRPKQLAKVVSAFNKAINLDQEVIVEAYIEFGFIAEIRRVNSEVERTVADLARNMSELAIASHETGSATTEVAATAQQVAAEMATQRGAADEVAAATHSLAKLSKNIADGALAQREALNSASSAVSLVSEATVQITEQASMWSEIKQRIRVIDQLKATVRLAAESARSMLDRSREIGSIVKTIEEIANQTNLLSLNAAIEAARAGEHGRGFAVVADEVRILAESSSASAKQIVELIQAIQTGSEESAKVMDQTVSEVDSVMVVTTDAASCLEAISNTADEIQTSNTKLLNAMESVDDVVKLNESTLETVQIEIDQVTSGVERIVNAADLTATATESLSAAAEEMSAQTEELSATISEVDSQIHGLHKIVEASVETVDRNSSSKASTSTKANLKVA